MPEVLSPDLLAAHWRLPSGPNDAITDVEGVSVGHADLAGGPGVRTGVTVVVPSPDDLIAHPRPAAVHVINGYGKSAGLMQVEELGEIETPIALTGTFGVPAVQAALLQRLLRGDARVGGPDEGRTVNAVVLECNDARLHDPRAGTPDAELVERAFADADADVAQGPVGAGSGMLTFGYAGGIGTASRLALVDGDTYVVGVLGLTNFGQREDLVIAGRPVGRDLEDGAAGSDHGSAVFVLATDCPVDRWALRRIARRAQNGLARTGCLTGARSGELMVAFSTRTEERRIADLDPLFAACAEAVEAATISVLRHSHAVSGREGRIAPGFSM
jgi:D-aminopeptidase